VTRRAFGRIVGPGLAVAAAVAIPSPAAATEFKAQFLCNDRGVVYPIVGADVAFLKREDGMRYLWGGNVIRVLETDAEGRVSTTQGGSESNFFFRLVLKNRRLELRNWYGSSGPGAWWFKDTDTNQNDVAVQDYGAQVVGDARRPPECALWEGLRLAFDNYVATAPPDRPPKWGNTWVLKLYAPTRFGAPFAHNDQIDWPADYPPGNGPDSFTGLFREFGKTVLHGMQAAGDTEHLGSHFSAFGDFDAPDRPCRRTNVFHAFNDGWGEWWAGAYEPAPNCPGIGSTDYTVAGNVAAKLAFLERVCPGGRRRMIEAFEWFASNRPHIHTLADFQRALGCFPGEPGPLDADRTQVTSVARVIAFAKRQIGGLRTVERDRSRRLPGAVGRSRRESRCPPLPCTSALDSLTLPFVLRAELQQARLLRRTLSFATTLRGLRRVGGSSETQWLRAMNARARAFRVGAARIGATQLRLLLNAAAGILRRDRSPATQAAGRQLRALLRTFRAGQLPAGFLITPAASPLRQGAPVPNPSSPSPPLPPPQPGVKPDLVVDSVRGFTCDGAQTPMCQMRAVVRNAGAATAPPSKTAIAANTSFQNEQLVDTPALAPGQSTTLTGDCGQVPNYGSGDFSARADATALVDESSESNNSLVNAFDQGEGRCVYN
jgi:CARDB